MLATEKPRGASPFIKWAGGKRGILAKLNKRLPKVYRSYFEPFIGGGALFFYMSPKSGYICDINKYLIASYEVVRDHPDKLMESLDHHRKNHCKNYYYKVRGNNIKKEDTIEYVSRFIYLNKTCYNGLHRVNKSGHFNVPMGGHTNINLYDRDNMLHCSHILKSSTIKECDFSEIKPEEKDFVYFDPPYHNTYTDYNYQGFCEKAQVRLAKFCRELNKKGVLFMLSNSNTELINKLYEGKDFIIEKIVAPRSINCKGNNRKSVEVLIRNYKL